MRRMIQAEERDLAAVHDLVCRTIRGVYPVWYPREAVDSFLDHYCPEHIWDDIRVGNVWLLQVDETVVATGTAKENQMNRVFVLPDYQGHGHGSAMMEQIEAVIARRFAVGIQDLPETQLHPGRPRRTPVRERSGTFLPGDGKTSEK